MNNQMSEIVSLLFMAIALGMDSFSVSLGMGMQQLRLKRILLIGIVFGLFHIIFPFVGIVLGKVLYAQISVITSVVSGLVLIALGTHMILSSFNKEEQKVIQPFGIGLFLLGLSVSIDSFSVGFSLGISGVKTALALLLFGTTNMFVTWSGLLLGRKVRGLIGLYSEMLGGSILCSFGLYIMFS